MASRRQKIKSGHAHFHSIFSTAVNGTSNHQESPLFSAESEGRVSRRATEKRAGGGGAQLVAFEPGARLPCADAPRNRVPAHKRVI